MTVDCIINPYHRPLFPDTSFSAMERIRHSSHENDTPVCSSLIRKKKDDRHGK
ncbi:MAG: hypothetical protein JW774_12575 [Candidatus Aureabacteria bacterium]|nr:hypothetical protein [Candidatus Auribacterota bacterium]